MLSWQTNQLARARDFIRNMPVVWLPISALWIFFHDQLLWQLHLNALKFNVCTRNRKSGVRCVRILC